MNDKNKLNYRDFKVTEFDGKYYIFRRKRITKVSGHLWWKVTNITWEWRRVDKKGDIINLTRRGVPLCYPLKPRKTLWEAMNRIEVFVKGAKAHYHPKAFDIKSRNENE